MTDAEIVLVSMPYAAAERPSLALGLLTAQLRNAGLAATALYPCIEFAERIGLGTYEVINASPTNMLVGEWTFSPHAFPEMRRVDMHYLSAAVEALQADVRLQSYLPRVNVRRHLTRVRDEAGTFVGEVADAIVARKPRIVGCSSTFQQHCASLALLRAIRERDASIVTVIGGANCESTMGLAAARAFRWLDFVVSGEADEIIVPLMRLLLERGRDVDPGQLPLGVIRGASTPVAGPAPRASVWDLDRLPMPDYADYFDAVARSGIAEFLSPGLVLETSRGCWWGAKSHCTFCGLNGESMKYRSKQPDRALVEIDALAERHGIRRIELVDNIMDMAYHERLLPKLAGRGYDLFYETKANLKRHHMERFAAAGVRYLQPGIESMHDDVLKLLAKGNKAWMNVQLLKWARELGIAVGWVFLINVPGERDEWYAEMSKWLPLIAHLQPPDSIANVQFHRFSPYHRTPEAWDLELVPDRSYAHVYPLAADQLSDFAYFFERREQHARPNVAARRSALQSTVAWLHEWRRQYWVKSMWSPAPRLVMKRDGDGLVVHDTRSCRVADEHRLDRLAARIYAACDTAVDEQTLAGMLAADDGPADAAEVMRTVDELLERKLMLRFGRRLLALAVTVDVPVEARPFPGGDLELGRYTKAWLRGEVGAMAAGFRNPMTPQS